MKIQISKLSVKFRFFSVILIFTITAIIWLMFPVNKESVEESMYEHFNTRLGNKIEKISCYSATEGKDLMTYKLACNYISANNVNLGVKYIGGDDIHAPIWAISRLYIDGIDYARNPHLKVQLSIHSFGNADTNLSVADSYFLDALVDGISNNQLL